MCGGGGGGCGGKDAIGVDVGDFTSPDPVTDVYGATGRCLGAGGGGGRFLFLAIPSPPLLSTFLLPHPPASLSFPAASPRRPRPCSSTRTAMPQRREEKRASF